MGYIAVALVVLLISMALFHRAGGSLSLTRLNMTTFTFYVMAGSMFFGATGILLGGARADELVLLRDRSVLVLGWAGVMYAMIAVPAGMLIAEALLRRGATPGLIERYRHRAIEPGFTHGDRFLKFSLKLATVISALALGYTFTQLDTVPLLSVIRGETNATVLSTQRAAAHLSREAGAGGGLVNDMADLLVGYLQVLVVAAFFYWRRSRLRSDLRWFMVALAMTVLSLTFNISKAPIVIFMANALVVIVASSVRGIRLATVVLVALAGSAVIVVMYVYYRNALEDGRSVMDVWQAVVFGRTATGNLISYLYCLDLFPAFYPHIGLASTGRMLHEWMGMPFSADYGLVVMNYYDPNGVALGQAGHMTAIFLGEAWANFGWVGLLGAPPFVGAVIQTYHIWFLTSPKSPLHLGLYTAVLSACALYNSGLKPFYYPAWLVQLAAVSLCVVGLAQFLRFLLMPTQRVDTMPARAVPLPATPRSDSSC